MSEVIDFKADIPSKSRSLDEGIAGYAGQQHGLVTHQQLSDLGFSASGIQYRVQAGRLHRIHRGVYVVGRPELSERGRLLAAVLTLGQDALLSHRSAAALWGISATGRRSIEVTALQRNHVKRAGIAVHLVRELHPDDRASVEGIPVTSVARTLLDLAGVVRSDILARALERAERLRLFDLRAIDALLARSQGRRGVKALRQALLVYREPPHLIRSELERRFLDLCRSSGLPPVAVNAWVAGQEVDIVWPEQRLVVELDGRSYHETRAAFERDRRRDANLQLAGYRVLRVTRLWLDTEPAAVIAAIRRLLKR